MARKAMGVALVTGASGVIGGAVARRLASDGYEVVAQHAGEGARIDALISGIEAAGGRAVALEADIGGMFEVRALFADIEAGLGGLDAVIHCAGAHSSVVLGAEHRSRADIRETVLVLSQAASQVFNGGRIVLLSGGDDAPAAGHGFSGLSFAATQSLIRFVARSAYRRNITVNALASTLRRLAPSGAWYGAAEGQRINTLVQQAEQPEDIANVVSFLVGPEGAWVNGQVLSGTCAA